MSEEGLRGSLSEKTRREGPEPEGEEGTSESPLKDPVVAADDPLSMKTLRNSLQ